MNKNHETYLKDILSALKSIETFVKGMNYDEFQKDDKTTSAVIRKFEILGEATKNISKSIRNQYQQIPWKEIAGMRDRLIHGYSKVDISLVWETIQNRLPSLKTEIQKILSEKESIDS